MAEKNIDISAQFPKPIEILQPSRFDLILNMSGYPLPGCSAAIEWKVRDPIGGTPEQYRAARDQIERLVMNLILELRRNHKTAKS
jgi:protein-tyrosine-phosphatase